MTVVVTDVAGNEARVVTPVTVTLAPVAAEPGPTVEPATPRVGVALTAAPGTWLNGHLSDQKSKDDPDGKSDSVVVMGDFNTEPYAPEIAGVMLDETHVVLRNDAQPTVTPF